MGNHRTRRRRTRNWLVMYYHSTHVSVSPRITQVAVNSVTRPIVAGSLVRVVSVGCKVNWTVQVRTFQIDSLSKLTGKKMAEIKRWERSRRTIQLCLGSRCCGLTSASVVPSGRSLIKRFNCASVLAAVDSHQRPSFPQVNSNPGPV